MKHNDPSTERSHGVRSFVTSPHGATGLASIVTASARCTDAALGSSKRTLLIAVGILMGWSLFTPMAIRGQEPTIDEPGHGSLESGIEAPPETDSDATDWEATERDAGTAKATSGVPSGENASSKGVQFFAPRRLDLQFGMRFRANDNFCTQLYATVAFPTDWPEQKVVLKPSNVPNVAAWQFRDLPANAPPTARQLVMTIPGMQPGGELDIVFAVEVEKSFIQAPSDTSLFRIPKKIPKELNWHMGNSPMIDAGASDIKRIAKSIKESQPADAWTHVEMIYDWVRSNIEYTNGPIRNTREAMKDKKGDCEEMSGIFIAICRASGIPSRCVWIPEHCYPEFYLEDDEGQGHWFPCQVAGDRQFGQMHDYRPILQKGDRFKVPEKNVPQHYLSEFFKCKQRAVGPRAPSVEPVLDLGPLKQEIDAMQAEVRGRRE